MTIFVTVSGGVAEVVPSSIPSVKALKSMKDGERLEVEIIDFDNLKADRARTLKQLSSGGRRFVRELERYERRKHG